MDLQRNLQHHPEGWGNKCKAGKIQKQGNELCSVNYETFVIWTYEKIKLRRMHWTEAVER